MLTYFESILIATVVVRLISVGISISNESKLKRIGSIEHGRRNSRILTVAHFAFYGSCMLEGNGQVATPDNIAMAGLVLYIFAIAVLYYVISELRHIWTVKLIIAPRRYHVIIKSPLFRRFRHPNYYLSIIPELFGFALVFHAWHTLLFGLPLYLIPLTIRIKQEEYVMRSAFENY